MVRTVSSVWNTRLQQMNCRGNCDCSINGVWSCQSVVGLRGKVRFFKREFVQSTQQKCYRKLEKLKKFKCAGLFLKENGKNSNLWSWDIWSEQFHIQNALSIHLSWRKCVNESVENTSILFWIHCAPLKGRPELKINPAQCDSTHNSRFILFYRSFIALIWSLALFAAHDFFMRCFGFLFWLEVSNSMSITC